MKIAIYIFSNNSPTTFNPAKPISKQSHSVQNEPNFEMGQIPSKPLWQHGLYEYYSKFRFSKQTQFKPNFEDGNPILGVFAPLRDKIQSAIYMEGSFSKTINRPSRRLPPLRVFTFEFKVVILRGLVRSNKRRKLSTW